MNDAAIPELKELIGGLLFAAKQPISTADIRRVLKKVAEDGTGYQKDFGSFKEKDVRKALESFEKDLEKARLGMEVVQVNNGYRLVNRPNTGPWIRAYLEKGKGRRLSKPALETLAIIAYRQPATKAEIEAVRGVEVDQMVKNLLEVGLIKVIGRSEMPGRPFLLGTTNKFMEHFGLNRLDDLPGINELRRMEKEVLEKDQEEDAPAAASEPEPAKEEPRDVIEEIEQEDAEQQAADEAEQAKGGGVFEEDPSAADETEVPEDGDAEEFEDEEDEEDDD